MNTIWMVDAIVRQTVILISQVATRAGTRAPLAHVADLVFADLVRELQTQGVSHKVIADMFGMALRTYHRRVREFAESHTDRGRTLWEAVLGFVQSRRTAARGELFRRFHRDDEVVLRAVLRDLVDSKLLTAKGRGDRAVYRIADRPDSSEAAAQLDEDEAASLLWVELHTYGPSTATALHERTHLPLDTVESALGRLVDLGRADVDRADGAAPLYRSEVFVVPVGASEGWQAALLDHFQTLTKALMVKMSRGELRSHRADEVGGSTYHLRLWDGHPHQERALSLLADLRRELSQLRDDVNGVEPPTGQTEISTVHFYFGQYVEMDESGEPTPPSP